MDLVEVHIEPGTEVGKDCGYLESFIYAFNWSILVLEYKKEKITKRNKLKDCCSFGFRKHPRFLCCHRLMVFA